MMHALDLSKVSFTGEALTTLRGELDGTGATLLGFVGSPFTLGTYIVEGQISDSWGGQLPPTMWESISKPSIVKTVELIRAKHPETPLTLYANGSGGLLERLASTGVNCVG